MSTFYRSIVAFDLEEARAGADADNLAAIPAYVEYLSSYAPPECYGSFEKVAAWCGLRESSK